MTFLIVFHLSAQPPDLKISHMTENREILNELQMESCVQGEI